MKRFITSLDVEALATAGERELVVEPGMVVTAVAVEAAGKPGGTPEATWLIGRWGR